MIVLRKGKLGEEGTKKNCPNCKSLLIYFENDIQEYAKNRSVKCCMCAFQIPL